MGPHVCRVDPPEKWAFRPQPRRGLGGPWIRVGPRYDRRVRARMLVAAALAVGGCSIVVETGGLSSGGADPVPAASEAGAESGGADADAGADVATNPDTGVAPDAAVPTLVGDWPFDEGTGTIIHDKSGRGHDGTAIGGTWVADHKGTAANALFLNGSSAFVAVVAHTDFDRPSDAQLTLAAWMRMEDAASHDMFFSVSYGDNEQSFGIELVSPTELTYWDSSEHAATATIPTIGTGWHHYGIVADRDDVSIYFDGARVSQGKCNTSPKKATQVMFGRSTFGDRLHGAIDNMRFYRRALSDAEMLAEKNR